MKKIYKLHIENFLTIESLELDLSPGVIGFVGKNAEGKTNILTAIENILSGSNDPRLIKDGEKRAEIRIDEMVDDQVIASVSRVQTLSGNKLSGKLPGGQTPKNYLTEILDDIAINPIQIISNNPVTYLKNHLNIKAEPSDMPKTTLDLGFDFEKNPFKQCERQCGYYHDKRLELYKELKHKQEVIKEVTDVLPELPEKPGYNADDVFNKKRSIQKEINVAEFVIDTYNGFVNNEKPKRQAVVDRIQEEVDEIVKQAARMTDKFQQADEQLKNEIADLNRRYDLHVQKLKGEQENLTVKNTERMTALETAKQELKTIQDKIDASKKPDVKTLEKNLEDNELLLKELEEYHHIVSQHKQLQSKMTEAEEIKEAHKGLDDLYKYFAYKLPKALIERCNLPVKGIEFRDGELYVNDRYINRLSSAERSLVAVKLAVAMAKQKGHIAVCLDGIENLDEEHRKEFLDAVSDTGLKVLYTRHGLPEYEHEKEIVDGVVKE